MFGFSPGQKLCFDYDNATPVYIVVSATAIVDIFASPV